MTKRCCMHLLTGAVFSAILLAGASFAQTTNPGRISLVQDWSHRHVIFSGKSDLASTMERMQDPRYLHSWLNRNPEVWQARVAAMGARERRDLGIPSRPRRPREFNSQRDWSVSLGSSAGMAPGETPAKFTFDVTQAPSCTNDFVVFIINASAAAGTQANIVALNNLYTGPTSTSCGSLTAPTFLWAYAAGADPVFLSPILSLDGQKVAFVSSATRAKFNVLKWVAGQGTNATTGAVAPGSSGSSLTTLDYTNLNGLSGCTRSAAAASDASPYIDYKNDAAYVSANNGRLYRIKNVFNGTPAVDYCILISAGKVMSSPVYDSGSNKVYISDGQSLYAYTAGATSFTPAGSVAIAGTATSIVLSPVLDASAGYVYTFSRNDITNTNSIVSQVPISLASKVDAAIGPATTQYIFDGDFDNKYYMGGPASGSLYACGTQAGSAGNKPSLYRLTFNSSGIMNATPTMSDNRNITSAGNPNGVCAPVVDIFDGTNDRIFIGVTGGEQVTMWNINTPISSSAATPAATATGYAGTSAFTIDNFSSIPQASSIYFGTLATGGSNTCGAGNFCAVKLTQGALQ